MAESLYRNGAAGSQRHFLYRAARAGWHVEAGKRTAQSMVMIILLGGLLISLLAWQNSGKTSCKYIDTWVWVFDE
jgi:hypothetical protein